MMKIEAFLLVFAVLVCSQDLNNADSNVRDFSSSKVTINNDNVTMVTDRESVSFFIIGDWGGIPVFPFKTPIENKTSYWMNQLSKTYSAQFQIALGDNFYFHGVQNVNDKRFQDTYEKVFNTDYLKNNPWFITLGNHDHYGNAQAQIDYTKKSNRWIMPSFNYTVDVKTQGGNKTLISILMIDTVLMCGNTNDSTSSSPFFSNKKSDSQKAADYFTAFESHLSAVAATKVPYIIVAGHYPVWSVSEHGPTQCLVDKLRPLLHKYGVSAYLAGHDHNLQHIRDTYDGTTVDYILSGCSALVDNSTEHSSSVPSGSLKYFWGDKSLIVNGGFVVAQATTSSLTFTYYETTGKSLYQTTVKSRY